MTNGPAHTATMTLPKGAKQKWTLLMQGEAPVPDEINPGSPIVMAYARFNDGLQVVGGVYKGDNPTDFNVKFMWLFNADGTQYPGWPIDVGDHEDFFGTEYVFELEEQEYQLNVVEA